MKFEKWWGIVALLILLAGCAGRTNNLGASASTLPQPGGIRAMKLFGSEAERHASFLEDRVKLQGGSQVVHDEIMKRCSGVFSPGVHTDLCVMELSDALYIAETKLRQEQVQATANRLYSAYMAQHFEDTPEEQRRFMPRTVNYLGAAKVARLYELGLDKQIAGAERYVNWVFGQHEAWQKQPNFQEMPNPRETKETLEIVIEWGLPQVQVERGCKLVKREYIGYSSAWHRDRDLFHEKKYDPFLLETCGEPVAATDEQVYGLQSQGQRYLFEWDYRLLQQVSSRNLGRFARQEVSYCQAELYRNDENVWSEIIELMNCARQWSVYTALMAENQQRRVAAQKALEYYLAYLQVHQKSSVQADLAADTSYRRSVKEEARTFEALAQIELGSEAVKKLEDALMGL